MMLTRDDAAFIQRALELAERGEGHTRPNPPVGAVIVKNGKIIGEGWHKRCGGDHAEVAAIKDALKRTRRSASLPSGCVLYVTLEPCSKPGRVGACTDAIVAALGGVVSVPTLDGEAQIKIPAGTPNGKVFRLRGKGVKSLRGGTPGDIDAKIVFEVPTNLNRKQREALEEFQKLMTNANFPDAQTFENNKRIFFAHKEKLAK